MDVALFLNNTVCLPPGQPEAGTHWKLPTLDKGCLFPVVPAHGPVPWPIWSLWTRVCTVAVSGSSMIHAFMNALITQLLFHLLV